MWYYVRMFYRRWVCKVSLEDWFRQDDGEPFLPLKSYSRMTFDHAISEFWKECFFRTC